MTWKDRAMSYLSELDRHADDPHVKPINDYIRTLRDEQNRFVPFVSPRYGGVNARLLALQKSPGARTISQSLGGTGFLDANNPDRAAKRHTAFLKDADIPLRDTLSWNSLPWFDADFDSAREWNAGVEALNTVIDKLDNLAVIMLHGVEACKMWELLERRHRATAERFRPIRTRSLGNALVDDRYKSKAEVTAENTRITRDFASAARRLRYAPKVGTRALVEQRPAVRAERPTSSTGRNPLTDDRRARPREYNPKWDDDWGREWPLPPEER